MQLQLHETMMAHDLARWMSEVRFYVFWIGGLTRVAAPTASMTEDKAKQGERICALGETHGNIQWPLHKIPLFLGML